MPQEIALKREQNTKWKIAQLAKVNEGKCSYGKKQKCENSQEYCFRTMGHVIVLKRKKKDFKNIVQVEKSTGCSGQFRRRF